MMDTRITLVFALVLALTTVQTWQAEIEFAGEIAIGDSTAAFEGRASINRWTPDKMMTIEFSIGGLQAWRAESSADGRMTIYWADGSRQELDLPPGFLDSRGGADLGQYVAGLAGAGEDAIERETQEGPAEGESQVLHTYKTDGREVLRLWQSLDVDERGLPVRMLFAFDESWSVSADFSYTEIK